MSSVSGSARGSVRTRATGSHRKRGTLLPGPGPGGVPWGDTQRDFGAGLYCLSWKSPLHLGPVPSEDTLTVSKDRPCLLAWLAEAVAPVGFPAQEPHIPCDLPQFDSRTGLCVCSSHAAPRAHHPQKSLAAPRLASPYVSIRHPGPRGGSVPSSRAPGTCCLSIHTWFQVSARQQGVPQVKWKGPQGGDMCQDVQPPLVPSMEGQVRVGTVVSRGGSA